MASITGDGRMKTATGTVAYGTAALVSITGTAAPFTLTFNAPNGTADTDATVTLAQLLLFLAKQGGSRY